MIFSVSEESDTRQKVVLTDYQIQDKNSYRIVQKATLKATHYNLGQSSSSMYKLNLNLPTFNFHTLPPKHPPNSPHDKCFCLLEKKIKRVLSLTGILQLRVVQCCKFLERISEKGIFARLGIYAYFFPQFLTQRYSTNSHAGNKTAINKRMQTPKGDCRHGLSCYPLPHYY